MKIFISRMEIVEERFKEVITEYKVKKLDVIGAKFYINSYRVPLAVGNAIIFDEPLHNVNDTIFITADAEALKGMRFWIYQLAEQDKKEKSTGSNLLELFDENILPTISTTTSRTY